MGQLPLDPSQQQDPGSLCGPQGWQNAHQAARGSVRGKAGMFFCYKNVHVAIVINGAKCNTH